MGTIAQRIREALGASGMKQADLVRQTGLGKSSISTYLSGAYEPKQRAIHKIAVALDVNEAWLLGQEDIPMQRVAHSKRPGEMGYGYLSYIEGRNAEASGGLSDLQLKQEMAQHFSRDSWEIARAYEEADALTQYLVSQMLRVATLADDPRNAAKGETGE